MDLESLFKVSGKVVLVTGGSSGIGLMIATAFVSNGAKVYISSRKADVCADVAKNLSNLPLAKRSKGACYAIPADLATEEGCKLLARELAVKESHLDVLVNNAGAVWGAPIEEFPAVAFDKIMNLNVRAIFLVTQQCLPLLQRRATNADPARVINIGSINGLGVSFLDTFSYSASKAAVHHMTRVLASKLASRNITVNAIAPGPFPSKMTKHVLEKFEDEITSGVPFGRVGRPEDMAGICLLLAAPSGAYITGTVTAVDGGSLIKASL